MKCLIVARAYSTTARLVKIEEFSGGDIQCFGNCRNTTNRRIAFTSFYPSNLLKLKSCSISKLFLSYPFLLSQLYYSTAYVIDKSLISMVFFHSARWKNKQKNIKSYLTYL